jgi:hypothetical protein
MFGGMFKFQSSEPPPLFFPLLISSCSSDSGEREIQRGYDVNIELDVTLEQLYTVGLSASTTRQIKRKKREKRNRVEKPVF